MLAGVLGIAVMLVLLERNRNQIAPRIAINWQAQTIAQNTPVPNSNQPPTMGQLLYGRAH